MGIELARAFVTIAGDHSHLDEDLHHTEHMVEGSMKSIAAGAASILEAFYHTTKHILGHGLDAAGTAEQTKVEFEAITGSVEGAQEAIEHAHETAMNTGLSFPGLLETSKKLITTGDSVDQMTEHLDLLTQASMGSTQKLHALSYAFTMAKDYGQVTQYSFRNLSRQGLITMTDLAKFYGVTREQALKMVRGGKVSFGEFEKLIKQLVEPGGRLNGVTAKMANTYKALQVRIEEAWHSLYKFIAMPLIPYYEKWSAVVFKVIDGMVKLVQQSKELATWMLVGAAATAGFTGAIFTFEFAVKLLGISIKKFLIGTSVGAFLVLFGAGLGALIHWMEKSKAAQDAVTEAWGRIKGAVQPAIDAFNSFFTENAERFEELRVLWDDIMSVLLDAVNYLVDGALSAFNWMVGSSVTSIKGMFQFILDSILRTLDWISLLSTNWTLTWEFLKAYTRLTFWTVAMVAMEALLAIPEAAVSAAMAIWTAFKTALTWWVDLNIKVITIIGDMFKALWESIKSGFSDDSIFSKMVQNAKKAMDKLVHPEKSLSEIIAEEIGTGRPFEMHVKAAQDDINRIKKQMEDARAVKRIQRVGPLKMDEKEKEKEKETDKKMMQTLLKDGRIGFKELGNKMQDALIGKDAHALGQEQVDLAKQGLKKQDELIKAVKEGHAESGLEGPE